MNAVGWLASMSLRARLVVLLLLFPFPLVSFEVPPFPFPFPGPLSGGPGLAGGASQTPRRRRSPPTPSPAASTSATPAATRASTMRMRLVDRQGRVRERTLRVIGLRRRRRAPAPSRSSATACSFDSPPRPTSPGRRFSSGSGVTATMSASSILPALGRVRRIAGSERQESFVGSDFSYEDIGGRALDDYTYAHRRRARRRGPRPMAPSHPAWVLESRARDRRRALPARAVDRSQGHLRRHPRRDLRSPQRAREGVPREAARARFSRSGPRSTSRWLNHVERTRTELSVTSVRYDTGLTENDFSRRELERGVR